MDIEQLTILIMAQHKGGLAYRENMLPFLFQTMGLFSWEVHGSQALAPGTCLGSTRKDNRKPFKPRPSTKIEDVQVGLGSRQGGETLTC